MIGATNVTLIPVAPAPVLGQVLTAYDGGNAAAVLFTLPFGMIAAATLPARTGIGPIGLRRPGLAEVRPSFTAQDMTGGLQVSLTQGTEQTVRGPVGLSLPGATVQLRNLVDENGDPVLVPPPPAPGGQPVSVLGPAVDEIFNAEFGPGERTALVPVTRIDFSGYGASSFSDWTDPAANPPAVTQVRFTMMVGRASHEVVQVKSILYPWGAIVVRTITIERHDDNEISRYDSGWVAATPGTFGIPGITVHPGAVTGAFNIRQIQDTTQTYTSPAAAQLTGVYFDADIEIAGVTTGASGGLVPSIGQFGFVQTAPVGSPLTSDDLAALISRQGSLGGPVNCVVAIAGTRQTMRVSRIEVDNAPHPGVPQTHEFAATARGSVVLPRPGNWSVLARTDTVKRADPGRPRPRRPADPAGPGGRSAAGHALAACRAR